MKLFSRVSLIVLTLLVFTECKKGEDDPNFSFRTRKARLEGNWRMTSGGATYSEPGYNESYTFNGNNYKGEAIAKRYKAIYNGNYGLNLNIRKNGSFELTELIETETFNGEGTWNFNNGVGEAKRKENIIFLVENLTRGYTNAHFFNRFKASFVYSIRELRNKKLVISSTGKMYSSLSGGYATFSSHYTFEQ
jgi:hypothetical protein